jgi:hypothetical protein
MVWKYRFCLHGRTSLCWKLLANIRVKLAAFEEHVFNVHNKKN